MYISLEAKLETYPQVFTWWPEKVRLGSGRVTEEEKSVQGRVIKVCYGQRACFYKPQGSVQNASHIPHLRTGAQALAQSCLDSLPPQAQLKARANLSPLV